MAPIIGLIALADATGTVEKKAVNAGTICSYQCNAQTNWCAQQLCSNGTLVQVVPCFGPFCMAKCAG